jgi:uncharacterized protein (TIGR03437 family)
MADRFRASQGATVVIAGEPAPIFYASNGQLNAAIPFDVTPNTSQQVLVTIQRYRYPYRWTWRPHSPRFFWRH